MNLMVRLPRSASSTLSGWWNVYSMVEPFIRLRSFVWFTGLRICFLNTQYESTSCGTPSINMTFFGRISLYESMGESVADHHVSCKNVFEGAGAEMRCERTSRRAYGNVSSQSSNADGSSYRRPYRSRAPASLHLRPCGGAISPNKQTLLQPLPYIFQYLVADFGVLFEERSGGIITAAERDLAEFVRSPAGFLDEPHLFAKREYFSFAGDAFSVHEIEFDASERRRYLVLYDLYAMAAAHDLVAFLYLRDAADIDAYRCVEFESLAAGRRFRVAEHDAYLHAYLVYEYDDGLGFGDDGGQFAERLRHEACLLAHLLCSHVTLDLVFGGECGNGIDDDDIQLA